jgi:hypothetical protein
LIFFLIVLISVLRLTGAVDAANKEFGTLSATLDRTSVPVGGVVWLTLDYRLPPGGRLPEEPETNGLDGISILNQIVKPGRIRLQLLVDQVGPWQSGSISLTYLDARGEAQLLTAPPISIQAVSNLGEKAEEAELRPISDIVPVISIWRSYLIWAAVFIALILIGLAVWWWYKRRYKPTDPAEYTEPPDIRARRELRTLESQQFFEKGLVKKYYFDFSEILRHYLESIRNFPAAEFTTEEITRHISVRQDRKLIPLLQQADLVKFADAVPTRARKEEDVKAALAYIRETSPQVESVMDHSKLREVQK